MLHPLQLQEISLRYAVEIAELRDYLGKAGIAVETPEAIDSIASSLRHEGAFRRDLTLHIWAILHAPGRQVSYPNAMAMLAVAAAGPAFAAEAAKEDTRELLHFVMEARTSFDNISKVDHKPPAPMPAALAAVHPVHFVQLDADSNLEPVVKSDDDTLLTFTTEDERSPRPLLISSLVVCAMLILCFGLWLHQQPSGVSTAVSTAPSAAANPEAAAADREAVQPSISSAEPLPRGSLNATRASHERPVPAPPAPRETSPRIRTTPIAAPAPRRNAPSPVVASTAPAAAIQPPATPARAPAKPEAHPDNPPQPVTRASRSDAPVYRGSDAPLVVLHTPVVRPVTLGNMASHLTYGPAPQYPASAVDQNVQGEVKLEAEVDRSGNVISTRVVSGPPLLQEAAVNALQSWQYRPYLYDGKPIAVNATVVMDFQLQ